MAHDAHQTAPGGEIRRHRVGEGLILTLDHPPANAITMELIAHLDAALQAAAADQGLRFILLIGAGRGFSAGMDPQIFGTVAGAAALGRVARRIEEFPKPVIAALHGTCLGAGLELAMACHWRIASDETQVGLPEIHLGLVPGSGGSQRLPRLVGGRHALRLALTGAPIPAAEALAIGLVDEVSDGNLMDDALDWACRRPGPNPTAARQGALAELYGPSGALAETRARLAGQRLPAPGRLVDCIEAAGLLPFEAGLALESTVFADLAASEEAAGLKAAWLAERRAARVPAEITAAGQPRITSLGLWEPREGATEMIVRALGSGLAVHIAAADRDGLVAVLNRVAARQDALLAEGGLTQAARDADWSRLTAATGSEILASADLILAAPDAPETIPQARRVLLGGLPKGQSGVALTLPDQPGGPAELALGGHADPALAALALALARRLGARTVFTRAGGPVLARLRRALGQAIAALEQAGTPRARITAALAAFGLGTGARVSLPAMPAGAEPILRACLVALAAEGARMVGEGVVRRPLEVDAIALHAGLFPRWEGGPLAWADRLGLMVFRADLWSRAERLPALYTSPPILDQLIAEGRNFGSLNGRL